MDFQMESIRQQRLKHNLDLRRPGVEELNKGVVGHSIRNSCLNIESVLLGPIRPARKQSAVDLQCRAAALNAVGSGNHVEQAVGVAEPAVAECWGQAAAAFSILGLEAADSAVRMARPD